MLILGSQSPRRSEILSFFSIPFKQAQPLFVEELVPFQGDPVAYASTLSEGKALSLLPHYPKEIILTADTVVFKDGKIFNKPANEEENFEMLKDLNGSWHSVFTALTATSKLKIKTICQESRVQFHQLEEKELRLYHRAFKGSDKSGGYSIQLGGSVIVKRIEGCFYNVVGLPIDALQKILKEFGINLWHYLVSS